jgi:hypothetical protein
LLFALSSPAQKGGSSPQKTSTRIGSVDDNLQTKIDKNWDRADKEEARQFDSLRKGEQPVTEDAKSILDSGARWYAYRLTIPDNRGEEDPTKPSRMHELVKQAMAQIVDPRNTRNPPNANQLAFKEEFDKRLIDRLNEVSRNQHPIVRVNAAMLLQHLAATGDEQATDVLADIIADPGELDAVRLWAFRGLKEFFAEGRRAGNDPFKNKDHEARCVGVLLAYLSAPRPPSPAADSQQAARRAAALNFVRAEAAAALAETRLPAVVRTVNKKPEVNRPTALVLLKLARGDGDTTEPGVAEQVNAAIGVCQLESKRCDEYQPDYAAYQLGRFVVEFVNRHKEAVQNNQAKREPWKVYSARLIQALQQLKEDTHRNDAAKYVETLVRQASDVLNQVANGAQGADPGALAAWLEQNPPKSASLYKGVASAVIREPDKSGE